LVFVMPVMPFPYVPPPDPLPLHSHNATLHAPSSHRLPPMHRTPTQSHSTAPTRTTTKKEQSISEFLTAIIRILVEVFETREAEIEALCCGLYELKVRRRLLARARLYVCRRINSHVYMLSFCSSTVFEKP
jgi:hypothetical protein